MAPTMLAFWILAVHFFRQETYAASVLFLALPFLLLVERRVARWLLDLGLGFGALVWLNTAMALVSDRVLRETPWTRGAAILFAMAAFDALAIALLHGRDMSTYFSNEARTT